MKSETVIEIELVQIVCRRTMQIIHYCQQCLTKTDFVTTVEAARIIQTAPPAILELAKSEVLHSLSANNGETYVCLASIERFEQNQFR